MATIGFIGMGNMARAIAEGLVKGGALPGAALSAYAPHYDRLKAFCDGLGMEACPSLEALLDSADTLLMAVKPYVVEEVLEAAGEKLKGKTMLSIATGWTLERYQPLLAPGAHIQYIMPNTPCCVGEGVLMFQQENTLSPDEQAQVRAWFGVLGRVEELPGHLMDAGTAVAGCGPAFAAMMLEALADAGVRYGLPRPTAYRLAAQMMAGTGKMQMVTGLHPGQIKDGVCSPGGTTIRGVEALEACGMRHAFQEAVRAVLEG